VPQISKQHKVQVTGLAIIAKDSVNADAQPTTFNECLLHWFRQHNPKDAWILDELDLVGDHMVVVQSIQNKMARGIGD
jgi:hypothetical protein